MKLYLTKSFDPKQAHDPDILGHDIEISELRDLEVIVLGAI